MDKFESTLSDLRDSLDAAEGLSASDRKQIDVDVDALEAIFNRMEEERDAALDLADATPDEDDVNTEVRDGLARELEPIFGAIFAGDIDRAQQLVRQLSGTLGGCDPIIVAIQQARARPNLFLAA